MEPHGDRVSKPASRWSIVTRCLLPTGPAGSMRSELRFFGAPVEREGRAGARRDDLGDLVEVSGADLALMASRAVAGRLGGELGLLELGVGGHAVGAVLARQLEHPEVEGVKA